MYRVRAAVIAVMMVLALQACVSLGGVDTAPGRSPGLEATRRAGTVTLETRLAITPHRSLLAVVNPWAATDIDHVRLELFQGATSKGTLTVTQAQLGNTVRINNLASNTSYTIQARAWQDVGETVSIDNFDSNAASCTTAFSTTSDDVLSLAGGVALRLRDRTFSGLGTGAIAVTPGGYVSASPEALGLFVFSGASSTVAGSGSAGFVDGLGLAAAFDGTAGVAADLDGNLFVADQYNNRVRKVAPDGQVTTLAGTGVAGATDGVVTVAQFLQPCGIALSPNGDLFVGDWNHRIRKITASGVVSTLAGSSQGFADGIGTAARFSVPCGLAVDATGTVFVADRQNNCIRKVSAAGVVTTLAGSGAAGFADGTGASAAFNTPSGVALDRMGNLFVADYSNNRIRKVTPAGVVTTVAGATYGYAEGTGVAALFASPYGVALDAAGNLFVADMDNHRIRKVTQAGVVSSLAGATQGYADGVGATAMFSFPKALAIDGAGRLYVADSGNQRIRKVQ